MINPQWLELPISRTNFHGPKKIRVIEFDCTYFFLYLSRSWQLQTKTCIPGFACSSYVKSASAAGAEEIITVIQRPKWQCSSMLWSMKSMTRHKTSHGHPLHPSLATDVLTLSCLWIQLGQDERVRLTARLSLTIIQFSAHVILISNTRSQQAHTCICKSYKSPVAMGERRSSR